MFKTEQNTQAMERRIKQAFHAWVASHERIEAVFEHGQWWVTRKRDGAQWSVVDASGDGSVDGFDFEMVTEGNDA